MVLIPLLAVAFFLPILRAACIPTAFPPLELCDLSAGSKIFLPSDPNYVNETTQRYTTHDAPTYRASVKPALDTDVQKIVRISIKTATAKHSQRSISLKRIYR